MKLRQIRVDGYKNLIDCKVNLGDFNVLVGPNNSGKSNLLEVIQTLFLFCFGNDRTREMAFRGFPISIYGNSISHIKGYENRDLSIGVTFEMKIGNNLWIVDYDFTAHREFHRDGKAMFIKEILQAKPNDRKGPRTIYLSRDTEHIGVETKTGKKEHRIALDISAFSTIKTLYPEFVGLPDELRKFITVITDIALTQIFLFSPDNLRESIYKKKETGMGLRESSIDIFTTIDEIHKDTGKFELFKNTVCDILDLEDLNFISKKIPKPSTSRDENQKSPERILRIYLKRRGSEYAPIDEYSDGTLVVVAILSVFLSEKIDDPILCVEELENCLHPEALEKLLRFLKEQSGEKPVLITTHSPYILNCVNPEDVNVAIVDETGTTHFKKVQNTKQLRDYLKTGFMSFGDMLASNFEDILGK